MRQSFLYVCGLAFALLIACPHAARAQTVAVGPYFATPSWDQTLGATRFVVLSNFASEAVLDRETGLVWERSPVAVKQPWPKSDKACRNATTGGRAGWRLPTTAELSSLLDSTVLFPALSLPAGHPFNVPIANFFFWTATPGATAGTHQDVEFVYLQSFGTFSDEIPDNFTWFSWCVRGPSPS
jgi:hypothetical protein